MMRLRMRARRLRHAAADDPTGRKRMDPVTSMVGSFPMQDNKSTVHFAIDGNDASMSMARGLYSTCRIKIVNLIRFKFPISGFQKVKVLELDYVNCITYAPI